MFNTDIELSGSIINPDKSAIENKTTIDISITVSDISASYYDNQVYLNYQKNETKIYVDETENVVKYYTPIYTEKLSYEAWKKYINKSFQELGAL
jgi:hypothetical protein